MKRFAAANHPPVPLLNHDGSAGVLSFDAEPGRPLTLSGANSSDPDGDALTFRWFLYTGAGSASPGDVTLTGASTSTATVTLAPAAAGHTAHVVLAVTDAGEPPLTRYRRAVIRGRK